MPTTSASPRRNVRPVDVPDRPRLGRHGAVVSPHHLASEAGLGVLRAGGNAVDAAIATNAALAVVAAHSLRPRWRRVLAHLGRGRDARAQRQRPVRLRRRPWRRHGRPTAIGCPVRGPWTVTVPGAVRSWGDAHARFGRLAWTDLLAPAIELAEGFPASWAWQAAVERSAADLRARLRLGPGLSAPRSALADRRDRGHPRACHDAAADRRRGSGERPTTAPWPPGPPPTSPRAACRSRPETWPSTRRPGRRPSARPTAARRRPATRRTAAARRPPAAERAGPVRGALAWGLRCPRGGRRGLGPPRPRGGALHAGRARPLADRPGGHGARQRWKRCSRPRGRRSWRPASTRHARPADGDRRRRPAAAPSTSPRPTDGVAWSASSSRTTPASARGWSTRRPASATRTAAPSSAWIRGTSTSWRRASGTMHTLAPGMLFRDGRPWVVHGSMGGEVQPQVFAQVVSALVDGGVDVATAVAAPRWAADVPDHHAPPSLTVLESRYHPEVVDGLRARGHDVLQRVCLRPRHGPRACHRAPARAARRATRDAEPGAPTGFAAATDPAQRGRARRLVSRPDRHVGRERARVEPRTLADRPSTHDILRTGRSRRAHDLRGWPLSVPYQRPALTTPEERRP